VSTPAWRDAALATTKAQRQLALVDAQLKLFLAKTKALPP
jgi:hypothetical protein